MKLKLNRKKYQKKIRDIYRRRLQIPKYSNALEFFKSGFSLTPDDRFKKFNIRYSPWVEALCEWYDDEETVTLFLQFGSQISKTTFMMGLLLYISQFVRGAVPIFWVMSTEDEALQFISERLKYFLDNAGVEQLKGKKWKNSAFRVFNSPVKVGYASTKNSLRSKAQRCVFGDEYGIWKETADYVMKRTRTFEGKNFHVFATTPPEDPSHHSVKTTKNANWYQWWVACPDCGEHQYLTFSRLKWYEKKDHEPWDYAKVKETTRYHCKHCNSQWEEHQKEQIINSGKMVCVDPETYEPCEPKRIDSKTVQINALYSVFTPWGKLACSFLTAKSNGVQAFKTFITDELAEVPKENNDVDQIYNHQLSKYIDKDRKSGFLEGFDLYTVGCDVQRNDYLYYTLVGWKRGIIPTPYILKFGKVHWGGIRQNRLDQIRPEFEGFEDKLYCVVMDATDGVVAQSVFDFCLYVNTTNVGDSVYFGLMDSPNQKDLLVAKKVSEFEKIEARSGEQRAVSINSNKVKNEVYKSFCVSPDSDGAIHFPSDITEEYLNHMTNEHRKEVGSGINPKKVWVKRYAGVPQHYWSSLVYGYAAMWSQRPHLLSEIVTDNHVVVTHKKFKKKKSSKWD